MGTGQDHPRSGEYVFVYELDVNAQGRPSRSAYMPTVQRVRTGTPLGDGLAQMVVGEVRRFWLPSRTPGGAMKVQDIELISIAGSRIERRRVSLGPRAARPRLPGQSSA